MNGLHPAEDTARAAGARRDAELEREPARRRAHGVVHTPPELARGTLAIVDELLQTRLGVALGASDPAVHLLDPACGPGAFVAAASRLWTARGRPKGVRWSAVDIDAAALASAADLAAHAPAAFALHRADVLREPVLLELAASEPRVLAIVGNPPWATARADKTPGMQALLEDFRCDARGLRLPERKLGVLSDVYVRFFRICAEAARRSERGAVLALISNGSFLDGPVHRGMRAALLRWFDELYVLDLGGSALVSRQRGARVPRDENVFGVRPSVTISWLCRKPGTHEPRDGRVFYARLRGRSAGKLEALASANLAGLGFEQLAPEPPLSRFVPRPRTQAQYAGWPSLAEWLPFHREGVQTNRDRLVVDRDRGRLIARLNAFARGLPVPELALSAQPHFSVALARRNLAEALERDPDGSAGISARRLAYRPFDVRWFCPVAAVCHRPRPELTRAIAHAGEVLVSVRKDRGDSAYTHYGAAAFDIDNCLLSTRSSCRARAFPVRTPEGADNLSASLRAGCEERTGTALDAATFARYALGFLASESYRTRYDNELHADYPRIPPPDSAHDLQALAALGAQLWASWVEPMSLPPSAASEPAPADSLAPRCSELRVDVARGGLFAGTQRVFACEPELLRMSLGHHAPFKLYLVTRADEAFDAAHVSELCALAERVRRIHDVARETDAWLRRLGHV